MIISAVPSLPNSPLIKTGRISRLMLDGNGAENVLGETMTAAIRRTKFQPAQRNGKPTNGWIRLAATFDMWNDSDGVLLKDVAVSWNGSGVGNLPKSTPVPVQIAVPVQVDGSEPEADVASFVVPEVEPTLDRAELLRNTVYPELARRNGIEGTVAVEAYIDTEGHATKFEIRAMDNSIFKQAAIDAVRKTQFSPAIQNKRPMATWLMVVVEFKL